MTKDHNQPSGHRKIKAETLRVFHIIKELKIILSDVLQGLV